MLGDGGWGINAKRVRIGVQSGATHWETLMGSPFPGMDPYLEQHWRDVHHRLTTYACDALQKDLPPDLKARLEERAFVEASDAGRSVYPDIRVIERANVRRSPLHAPAGAAVADPLVLRIENEPVTEGFIQIIDVGSGNRVITVIELLSLSNKLPGEGQELHLKKQQECRAGGVRLVEIDLLRDGKRVLAVAESLVPADYKTSYRVCVRRGWQPMEVELYKVTLRERLPGIRVPLREADADVALELQPLIDQCYRNGGYEDLDYSREPQPPLSPDDAAWADELLRKSGIRV